MHGVLLVDKPCGMSSHRVVSILRKKLGTKKIGHAGTLDPQATGVLVCCVGKATKISQYLMNQDKVYQTDMILGATSTTYDNEGQIHRSTSPVPSELDISATLASFEGLIEQKPPIYSAIKKDGKKLYQYARAGIDVEIAPRTIRISKINLLFENLQAGMLRIEVHCQKGTYIRSLAHDVGQRLGCGAYAQNIRRLQSGLCNIKQCIAVQDLETFTPAQVQAKMLNIAEALENYFVMVEVNAAQEVHIRHGKPMAELDLPAQSQPSFVLLHGSAQAPIALTRYTEDGNYELLRVI